MLFRFSNIWAKFISAFKGLALACKSSTSGMIWRRWTEPRCSIRVKSTSAQSFSRTPPRAFTRFYVRFKEYFWTWRSIPAPISTSRHSSWTSLSNWIIGWCTASTRTWWIIHTNCWGSWQRTKWAENNSQPRQIYCSVNRLTTNTLAHTLHSFLGRQGFSSITKYV